MNIMQKLKIAIVSKANIIRYFEICEKIKLIKFLFESQLRRA
jgi:hypothetical protein